MTECIQARRTEWCQGSAVTGEGDPFWKCHCALCGIPCCSALVVSVLRSCHVIWSRWRGQGGSLSGMRMRFQTSCSSNKDCHSNDHSVSLTSDPHCTKTKQREGQAEMMGRTAGSNAQNFHQLDKQDGGAHQSPLGLLWLGRGIGREGPTEAEQTHHRTSLDHILSHWWELCQNRPHRCRKVCDCVRVLLAALPARVTQRPVFLQMYCICSVEQIPAVTSARRQDEAMGKSDGNVIWWRRRCYFGLKANIC